MSPWHTLPGIPQNWGLGIGILDPTYSVEPWCNPSEKAEI